VLLAFAAALLALRLAGGLVARWRVQRRPELALWALSLGSYALAAAALAWGAAAGWDARAFRAYYLLGGLLTAAMLGAGSLALVGRRWVVPVALVYLGLAIGVAISVPVHGAFDGTAIPAAQDHLDFVPARLLAVLGNSLGVLAAVGVAVATFRRRPLANAAILAGIAVAAVGSALGGLGVTGGAVSIALAVVLLYIGFTGVPTSLSWPLSASGRPSQGAR